LAEVYLRSLALATALGLAFGATALAGPPSPIRDCAADGDLDQRYSNSELRDALNRLPSDLAEYSNCGEVLHAAIGMASTPATEPSGGAAKPRADRVSHTQSRGGDPPKAAKHRYVSDGVGPRRSEPEVAGSAAASARRLEEPGRSWGIPLVIGFAAAVGLLYAWRRRTASGRS
jgi:hypothetical protein